jgi:hypothetical protein
MLIATVYAPPPSLYGPEGFTTASTIMSISYAIAALITNGASGLAGEYVARTRLSSNSTSSGRESA